MPKHDRVGGLQYLRSPRKVNHHLWMFVERQPAGAILAVVGPDRSKSVRGCVGQILILDAWGFTPLSVFTNRIPWTLTTYIHQCRHYPLQEIDLSSSLATRLRTRFSSRRKFLSTVQSDINSQKPLVSHDYSSRRYPGMPIVCLRGRTRGHRVLRQ
jgi:hypothetical protein